MKAGEAASKLGLSRVAGVSRVAKNLLTVISQSDVCRRRTSETYVQGGEDGRPLSANSAGCGGKIQGTGRRWGKKKRDRRQQVRREVERKTGAEVNSLCHR